MTTKTTFLTSDLYHFNELWPPVRPVSTAGSPNTDCSLNFFTKSNPTIPQDLIQGPVH